MRKKYVSVDVESSGGTPGKYSMLSLGACIVGETNIQFYREMQPINTNFVLDAMRIGSKGLECLVDLKHLPEYDVNGKLFNPRKVLKVLYERGVMPEEGMSDFADWIRENTRGFEAIELAAPIKFDGSFTSWYFDNFYPGENPLGFSGDDINSMYRGVKHDFYANIKQLGLRQGDLPHHALKDAIIQAREAEEVFKLMNA